jgi:hypothetical protein
MAKQRFAWSYSKGYTVKIFADTDQASYLPFEFETSSWEVRYDTQDAYQPGIVGSLLSVQAVLNTFPFAPALEQVAKDSDGIFYMELWQGLSKEWAGAITPSACTIEVINGARFMKIVAADNFYKLDLPTSMYTFAGNKRIILQIADIFTRLDLHRIFDGIAVSETTRQLGETFPYQFDGLYNTLTKHALFYYDENFAYRTYREILTDFCTIFGMRLYQDKGFLVFQDLTRVNDPTFSFYSMAGSFIIRRAFTTSTTLPVLAGGTKMFLPAVKQLDITLEYGSTQFAKQPLLRWVRHTVITGTGANPVYTVSDGIPLATYTGDGTTHFRFVTGQMQTTASYPQGYDSHYTIQFRLYLVYGTVSAGSSGWAVNNYLTFDTSGIINKAVAPGLEIVNHSLSNFNLATTPALGRDQVWIYLEAVQTAGDPLTLSTYPLMKYDITLVGTGQTETTFRADNSSRILGQKLQLRSRLGDIADGGPSQQALLYPAGNNIDDWLEFRFDGGTQVSTANALLQITAQRLCMQRAQPQEYYEIDMHGTGRFTHFGYWGNSYYIPISFSYTWDSCRATYAQFFSYDLVPSLLLVKNPTFELEA